MGFLGFKQKKSPVQAAMLLFSWGGRCVFLFLLWCVTLKCWAFAKKQIKREDWQGSYECHIQSIFLQ